MENDNQVIGEFTKNKSEKVVGLLSKYMGNRNAALQVWYETREGEWKPTGKTVSINVRLLEKEIEVLQQIKKQAESLGWLP